MSRNSHYSELARQGNAWKFMLLVPQGDARILGSVRNPIRGRICKEPYRWLRKEPIPPNNQEFNNAGCDEGYFSDHDILFVVGRIYRATWI